MIALIWKKEMASFFSSPLAWIIAGIFSLAMGWIFFNLLYAFVESVQAMANGPQSGEIAFVNGVVIRLFGNLNFLMLMICPLITMKLFAEERKDQSLDLYFAAPISDFKLVIGKYLTALSCSLFVLATTLIFPIILSMVGLEDFSFVVFGYLGLFLNIACYCAVGIFASSLTKSQVVAALLGFMIVMGFWLVSWVLQISSNYFLVQILTQLTMVSHYEGFVKGIFSTSALVYYLSFIFFWLFLTKKVLESRTW